MGTGRNVEIDDPSGKRSEDLAVRKMEFLEIDGRHRTFALSSQGRLRGSGFIDGVGGRKSVGQQWFQALQSAMGLCNLSIQRGQISFSLHQDESVMLGVDFEKHVAFLHRLVVLHIQFDDLTTHTRRNAHDIRARGRIVGPGMSFDDSPNVQRYQNRTGDDDYGYDFTNEFAPL